MDTTLLHNPACSKSREALALLQARGVAMRVVRYLDAPLDPSMLGDLLTLLGMSPRALLRTGEEAYTTLGLHDPTLDDATLVAAIAAHPRLMERPVFVHRGRAVIGRPPERVLELLDAPG